MRLTKKELKRAALQKRKATDEAEGSGQRAQVPPPAPPPTQTPPRPSPPPAQDEGGPEPRETVDLTTDSPGKRDGTGGGLEAAEPGMGPTEGAPLTADEGAAPSAVGEDAPSAPEGAGQAWPTGGSEARMMESAEGSRLPAIASRRSLMNHGKRAEFLVQQTCAPEFQAELHSQSAGSFFRDAYVAHLWVSTRHFDCEVDSKPNGLTFLLQVGNSLAAMRTVLTRSDAALRTTQRALEEAVARAERAEAAGAAQRATQRALEEAVARAERAEAAAEDSRAKAVEAAGKLDAASLAWAADLDAARSREMAAVGRSCLIGAELEMANAAIEARDQQIEGFVDAVKTAEARAAGAEAKAARAIEDFMGSEAFRLEVAEGAADAFIQGFEDGRDTVGRRFGLSGLEGIGPSDDLEEPGAGTGSPEIEAPTEGTLVEAPQDEVPTAEDVAAREALADRPPSPAEVPL